ncbi:MAG: hypothetical protein HY360_09395 [Verrucomicrobia bacterium]|nr:hypothetical protein [Verrucomicrobiota bacterium]
MNAKFRLACFFPVFSLAATLAAEPAKDVNLSLMENKAIPTASDSIDGTYNYLAGMFADGKSDTAWCTGRDLREHWARLQWRNLTVTVKRVELDFAPLAIACTPPKDFFEPETPVQAGCATVKPGALLLEAHVDGKWKTIHGFETAIPWRGDKAVITPKEPLANVKELRLKLKSRKADELFAVRELAVWGARPEAGATVSPKWKGLWLWGELHPTIPNFGVTKRYFRRTFKVADPAQIKSARLLFAAYDRGQVFLNGKEIARTGYPGRGLRPELSREEIDVKLFNKGKNLLAILGEDLEGWGPYGVLAELWLEKTDGALESIFTESDTFRASVCDEPGWNTSTAPFNHWAKANPVAAANGDPEGLMIVEYTPPYFGGAVQVTSVTVEPKIPLPGDRFTLNVTVKADQPLKDDYGLIVKYGDAGPVWPIYMDFSLGEGFIRPADALPKGFTGEKPLTLTGVWSDGTPGRLPLSLRLCNATGQLALQPGPVGEITPGEQPGWLRISVGTPPVQYEKKGFPDAKIIKGGRLAIDGQPVAPMIFTSSLQTPDRYQTWLTSGVKIFRIGPAPVLSIIAGEGNEQSQRTRVMRMLDIQVEAIHAMNPDAQFLLMVDLDAPNDWILDHPEELIMMPNNDRVISLDPRNKFNGFMHETPNSTAYLRKLRTAMLELVKTLEARPYAHSILGMALAHGRAGENYHGVDVNVSQDDDGNWVIPDRMTWVWGDVGVAARRNFRDWLIARYKTKEELAKAWKMDKFDFEDVADYNKLLNRQVTERLMWRKRPKGRFMFRDRVEEGNFYHDFAQHQNEANTELFIEAGRVIKEASGGRLLVGGYIGYNLPGLSNSPPSGAQHSGHTAIRMVHESPHMDFLQSPHYYHLRRAGDPVMPMSTVDSLRLHDKIWMNEFDSRTYLSPIDPKTFSVKETLNVFRKEFGYAITKDQGWWWLEFNGLVGSHGASWFSDSRLLADVQVMKRVYERYLTLPYDGPPAECAVIFNVEQPYYTDAYSPANTVGSAVVNFLIPRLFKLGPPFDLYAQTDLPKLIEKGWHKRYKLMLFVNSYQLTKEERALIDTHLKQDGRTLAFFFAPGYQGNEGAKSERSLEGIEQVTGIKGVNLLAEQHLLGLNLDAEQPSFKDCKSRSFDVLPWWGPEQINNYHQEIGPVFYLDAAKANGWTALGRLRFEKEEQKDKTALAFLKAANHQVFYSALPDLPLEALAMMVKESGAHSYTSKPGVLSWANAHFLCVHAPSEEKGLALTVKEPVNWIEPFEKKMYGKQTDRVTIDLERGETRFFCLEKKDEWNEFATEIQSKFKTFNVKSRNGHNNWGKLDPSCAGAWW